MEIRNTDLLIAGSCMASRCRYSVHEPGIGALRSRVGLPPSSSFYSGIADFAVRRAKSETDLRQKVAQADSLGARARAGGGGGRTRALGGRGAAHPMNLAGLRHVMTFISQRRLIGTKLRYCCSNGGPAPRVRQLM